MLWVDNVRAAAVITLTPAWQSKITYSYSSSLINCCNSLESIPTCCDTLSMSQSDVSNCVLEGIKSKGGSSGTSRIVSLKPNGRKSSLVWPSSCDKLLSTHSSNPGVLDSK